MNAHAATRHSAFRRAAPGLALVACVAAFAWWGWRSTRPLDRSAIDAFYDASRQAIIARDVATYCDLINPDFQGQVTAIGVGEQVSLKVDRTQACKQMGDLLDVASMSASSGVSQPLRIHHEVVQVTLGRDPREARVITSYRIELVDRMVITGASRDRLMRRANGVRLLESRTVTRTVMR